jgi:hypothetical protein
LVDFGYFWGSGALFEAKYWEEVRRRTPTQILHKSKVFDSPRRYINNIMMKNFKA